MASSSVADFVVLFYRHFSDGVVVPALQLPPSTVLPRSVSEQLEQYALKFEALPGLLQRAVLWDTRLLFSGGNDDDGGSNSLVQIWTRCGSSMADIAIYPQEIAQVASSSSSLSSWNLSTCLARKDHSTAFIASCDDPNALQPLVSALSRQKQEWK